MSSNLHPPQLPLRKADSSSKFLSKDLAIAYPMLDRGDTLVNYGFWGNAADLTLSNTTFSRAEGLSTLRIPTGAVAYRNGVTGLSIPASWSYAYWLKVDSAPTIEDLDIFTLQGPTEAHLRAWGDAQGIWSWQKYATADAYSIIPASDFPTSRLMLIVSVYSEDYLPPAQLHTNQGFSTEPKQPFSYTAFNEAQGAQATAINSIFLGNNGVDSAPLNGEIGPLYFWARGISDSEVWQLWQDPYAPFRRSNEQLVVPSAMQSYSSLSLEGIGKPTDLKPLFQDDNALVIYVQDSYEYVLTSQDIVIDPESGSTNTTIINVSDTYNYMATPTDSIDAPGSSTMPVVEINVSDAFTYVSDPTDTLTATAPFSLITINVSDNFTYVSDPTDTFSGTGSGTTTTTVINVSDTLNYETVPSETVTSSL